MKKNAVCLQIDLESYELRLSATSVGLCCMLEPIPQWKWQHER